MNPPKLLANSTNKLKKKKSNSALIGCDIIVNYIVCLTVGHRAFCVYTIKWLSIEGNKIFLKSKFLVVGSKLHISAGTNPTSKFKIVLFIKIERLKAIISEVNIFQLDGDFMIWWWFTILSFWWQIIKRHNCHIITQYSEFLWMTSNGFHK